MRPEFKHENEIPMSAATKNLWIALLFLAIGILSRMFNLPYCVVVLAFGFFIGFSLTMLMCVLDVQEFKMKQNQKIVELLTELAKKKKEDMA